MDRLTASLLAGAVAAVAGGPALATPAPVSPVPVAASYAELLTPIPNAVERLQLAEVQDQAQQPRLIEAQYHHHHDHHHNRAWYVQNGYAWLNGAWVLHPPHHHDHHHNRVWYLQNGYAWLNGAWVLAPHHHHHHNHY